MVQKIFSKIFGTSHQREMKKIQPLINKINAFESDIQKLSDEHLKNKTTEFQNRLKNGETVFDIMPEAFAVCREGSKRAFRSNGPTEVHC